MIRVTLKGVRGHLLRFLLTAIAVALCPSVQVGRSHVLMGACMLACVQTWSLLALALCLRPHWQKGQD